MFKRQGIYYAVFGSCCCYCGGGSPVTVYTAHAPLGPYTKRNVLGGSGNTGALSRLTALRAASGKVQGGTLSIPFGSQRELGKHRGYLCSRLTCFSLLSETDIFSYVDDAGAEQFMYIGDHWQSAPDRLKAHGERAENPVGIASNPLIIQYARACFFSQISLCGRLSFFQMMEMFRALGLLPILRLALGRSGRFFLLPVPVHFRMYRQASLAPTGTGIIAIPVLLRTGTVFGGRSTELGLEA